LRLEVGARDVSSSQCRLVRRDTGAKFDVPLENLGSYISTLLEEIQRSLFEKSKRERDEKIVQVLEWKDFVPALNRHCLVLTPFCDLIEWEEKVKVTDLPYLLC
jgi:prolyl-tRNA synthetase